MSNSNDGNVGERRRENELHDDELRRVRTAVLCHLGRGRAVCYEAIATASDVHTESIRRGFATTDTLAVWAVNFQVDEVVRMVADRRQLPFVHEYEQRRTLAIRVVGDAWLACWAIARDLDNSQQRRLSNALAAAWFDIFAPELDRLSECQRETAMSMIEGITTFASLRSLGAVGVPEDGSFIEVLESALDMYVGRHFDSASSRP